MTLRAVLFTIVPCILAGCTPSAEPRTTPKEPERIVTINGTLTEITAALGLADKLVGVDVTSTYPDAVKTVPKVGHDRNVRAEGVISLSPDLVLGATGQLDPAVRAQLEQAGERVILLPQDFSVEGTKELIRTVGDTLGRSAAVAPLIAAIDTDMQGLRPIALPPRVLFIYSRGSGSLMVAGEGTPMQRMIELAGGVNAVSGFEQFRPLTPEALIAADPDAILMFDSGLDALQGPDGLLQVPGMATTTAGRNKAFITMEGGLLSNFGPRVGHALAQLNAAFIGLSPRS